MLVSDGVIGIQVKPKQDEKDTSGPRLNEEITAQYVRLVTDEGISAHFDSFKYLNHAGKKVVFV